MEEFHCNCISCGKLPEQKEGELNLWVESKDGMLCGSCWKHVLEVLRASDIPVERRYEEEVSFCCFCVLCARTPPDPEVKIWVETEFGCLCELCMKRIIREGVEREIKKVVEGCK